MRWLSEAKYKILMGCISKDNQLVGKFNEVGVSLCQLTGIKHGVRYWIVMPEN